jgi:cytochrome c-type biogenesis protein CcmH/NrfF
VLHWLISDCRLFGLTAQNWMWVFPSGLLLYIAVLILVRRRQAGTR